MAIDFKDEEQKKGSIIAALTQLKNDIGWKVLVKALEENVKQAEARLHGDIKLEEGETMAYWQKIRKDRIQMMELPDTIINDNKERDEFDPKLDPFD